jgi:hypothetical protein
MAHSRVNHLAAPRNVPSELLAVYRVTSQHYGGRLDVADLTGAITLPCIRKINECLSIPWAVQQGMHAIYQRVFNPLHTRTDHFA